jgi:acyl-coenzyme A thioesterase 9
MALKLARGAGAGAVALRHTSHRLNSGIRNHIVEKTPITSQLWALRKAHKKNEENLLRLIVPPGEAGGADMKSTRVVPASQMLTKTVEASKLTLVYPFDTDESLRDLYVDHDGGVSIGKIFEDLDAMAGNIAHTHCDDNDPLTPPLSLVTASADNITLAKEICLGDRLVIAGE